MSDTARQIARLIDEHHLPEDAGVWAPELSRLLRRIPPGWGRWISCDAGWYPILARLEVRLGAIVPGWELHQVKEKFGTLRIYMGAGSDVTAEAADAAQRIVDEALAAAARTCERCGEAGSLRRTAAPSPWLKTVCRRCAGDRYLTRAQWDAWWADEQPRHEARMRELVARELSGRRILIASTEQMEPVISAERLSDPDAVRAALTESGYDEIWVGPDAAGEAAIACLAARHAGHDPAAGSEPLPGRGRVLRPPAGFPVLRRFGVPTDAQRELSAALAVYPSGLDERHFAIGRAPAGLHG